MIDKELARRFIDTLNGLVKLDREAIEKLILHRVECNEELSNHPTVQVRQEQKNEYSLGTLGLLNGLVGIQDDGWGYIAANFYVKCSNCDRKNLNGFTIGDKCPHCGHELVLGNLKEFKLIDHSRG